MYIKVQAMTEQRYESVRETAPDSFIISVRQKPERGMANRRVLELLSAHLGKGKRIRLISGHASPHKIVSVD